MKVLGEEWFAGPYLARLCCLELAEPCSDENLAYVWNLDYVCTLLSVCFRLELYVQVTGC